MIKRIVIDNFQSIEHLEVAIDAGITVFRGESRQGKSAILRAIKAVTSMPRGVRDLRTGAAKCCVLIETDKGIVEYVKERTGSVTYSTTFPNNNPIVKHKVTEVPREVFEILNIGNVEVDEDLSVNINYSSQLEPHFLLAPGWGTPAAVAKVIGKITNVDKLSLASRACAADLRATKMELSALRTKVEGMAEEMGAYDTLDREIEVASQVAQLELDVTNLHRVLSAEGLKRYKEADATKQVIGSKVAVLSSFPFKEFAPFITEVQNLAALKDTLLAARELAVNLDSANERLQTLNAIPFKEFAPFITEVQNLAALKDTLLSTRDLVTTLSKADNRLGSLNAIPFNEFAGCIALFSEVEKAREVLASAQVTDTQHILCAASKQRNTQDLEGTKLALSEYMKKTKVCPTCERAWEITI